MLYDERGRGIVAMNGQSVIVDEKGAKWLTKQRDPVTVDVAEWNEYTIIAQGNQLTHKLNGQVDCRNHRPPGGPARARGDPRDPGPRRPRDAGPGEGRDAQDSPRWRRSQPGRGARASRRQAARQAGDAQEEGRNSQEERRRLCLCRPRPRPPLPRRRPASPGLRRKAGATGPRPAWPWARTRPRRSSGSRS